MNCQVTTTTNTEFVVYIVFKPLVSHTAVFVSSRNASPVPWGGVLRDQTKMAAWEATIPSLKHSSASFSLGPDVFLRAESFQRRYSTFIAYIAFPRHFLHVFLLRILITLDTWRHSYAGIIKSSTYKGGERGGRFECYAIVTIEILAQGLLVSTLRMNTKNTLKKLEWIQIYYCCYYYCWHGVVGHVTKYIKTLG